MTPDLRASRRTIAIDEWAGYALLAVMCPPEWRKPLFVAALVAHLLTLYVVSYPELWRAVEAQGGLSPLRWLRALRGRS